MNNGVSSPLMKVGHVALITEDMDRSLWFWTEVVGLERADQDGDTVYLRAWGELEHHSLSLTPGSPGRIDHIGWRVRSGADVDLMASTLEAQEVEITWIKPDEERGQGRAIRFATPFGHRFELYHDVERPTVAKELRSRVKSNSSRAWSRGISPRRIDHVNITTNDADALTSWLSEKLGFAMREYIRLNTGTMAAGWMAVSALSHDIGVIVDPSGDKPDGFQHVAYFVDNAQDVLRAIEILRENGVPVDAGPGRHGISQGIFAYTRDPGSGHRLEIFTGGYLVLDADWEPIEWTEEEMPTALSWWGTQILALPEMDVTTDFGGQRNAHA
jgi:biphenyl-2,3-diol 1,2-dioxygenase